MTELLEKLIEESFKPSNYTIYNKIDDDGYVDELEGMFGVRYNINDFEKYEFNLSIKEKNGIKHRMPCVLNKFIQLKDFIEKKAQDNVLKPKAKVYINKDEPMVLIVKLKEFNLTDKIMDELTKIKT